MKCKPACIDTGGNNQYNNKMFFVIGISFFVDYKCDLLDLLYRQI